MHWPCGPLPAASLAATQKLTPELKETLSAWTSQNALDLVHGSPVNCLIVPWAEGSGADKEQKESIAPLVKAARERGLSVVGTIAGKQGVADSVATGMQAGLAALMVESLEGLPKDAPVILRTPRTGAPWETLTPLYSLTGNLWPKLGLDTVKEGDVANAGPTGVPWVNSNGWLSMLGNHLSHGKSLWLEYDPPESSDLDHPAGYALAIADACAYGSRWMISLDARLRHGLTQKDSRAAKVWEQITSSLKFFEANQRWSRFVPQGFLALTSDFRGDNEFMATEVMNLLSRRHLQYRIIEKSEIVSASLRGLKAILYVDSEPPAAAIKMRLRKFVEQGSLLISPTLWWSVASAPKPGGLLGHYQVYRLGLGSHAVPVEGMTDPYEVAFDTHMLMSRRNDHVRVFNVTASNALMTQDPQSGRELVQILNYTSSGTARPDLASVWIRTTKRSARFWSLGAAEPTLLQGVRSRGGWEFRLPFIPTYSALESAERGTQTT